RFSLADAGGESDTDRIEPLASRGTRPAIGELPTQRLTLERHGSRWRQAQHTGSPDPRPVHAQPLASITHLQFDDTVRARSCTGRERMAAHDHVDLTLERRKVVFVAQARQPWLTCVAIGGLQRLLDGAQLLAIGTYLVSAFDDNHTPAQPELVRPGREA